MLIVLAAYCRALTTLPVMGAIIACGVFLSVIAVVGVVGAVKHHQVSLFFYMLILFLIFLLQFSVACVCLSISKDQEKTFFQIGWELASNDLKMRLIFFDLIKTFYNNDIIFHLFFFFIYHIGYNISNFGI